MIRMPPFSIYGLCAQGKIMPGWLVFSGEFPNLPKPRQKVMDNLFYTYAYLRENGTPYYIGKGKGRRAFRKEGRAIKTPPKGRILLLKTGLTEEQAFRHEVYMIALYGRKDLRTGILYNFTDGGEGASGVKDSEETRKKKSQSHKGRKKSPEHRANIGKANTGKKRGPLSEEHKQKISLATKGRKAKPFTEEHKENIRKARIGNKLSQEHKEALIRANTGREISEETREKLRRASTGNKNFEGRQHTEETKEKIRQTNTGKVFSPEHKENISKAKLGNKNCAGRKLSDETKEKMRQAKLQKKSK